MRVERIEMFGFKSFHDRMKVTLDNLTGIVGPNGCGKSNVVDAIRWILGENRLSNLRGGTYEDVIFSGSTSKPPMSLAEVTLYITSEKSIFADIVTDNVKELQLKYGWLGYAQELEITRRVFRDGQSQFLINKTEVKLKELRELIKFLGLNPNGFTIVAQGEVSRIVTSKPSERHQIFEVASGIANIKIRIEEVRTKLQELIKDEATLKILVDDSTKRVESLRGEVEKYREYQLNLKELNRALAELKVARYQEASKTLLDIEAKMAASGAIIDVIPIELELAELDGQIAQFEENLDARKERIRIADAKRAAEKKEHDLLQEQVVHLQNVYEQIQGNQRFYASEVRKLKQTRDNLTLELADLKSELTSLETGLPDPSLVKSEIISVAADLKAIEEEIVIHARKNQALSDRLIKLSSTKEALTEELNIISKTQATSQGPVGKMLFEVLRVKDPEDIIIVTSLFDLQRVILSEDELLSFLRGEVLSNVLVDVDINERSETNGPQSWCGFSSAMNFFEVEERYKPLVSKLFADIFVAESLNQVLTVFDEFALGTEGDALSFVEQGDACQYGNIERDKGREVARGKSWKSFFQNLAIVVKCERIIVDKWGVRKLEEDVRSGSILRLTSRLETLNFDIVSVKSELSQLETVIEPKRRLRDSLKVQHQKLTNKLQSTYQQINHLQQELGGIKGRIVANDKILAEVKRDILANEARLSKGDDTIRSAERNFLQAQSRLADFKFSDLSTETCDDLHEQLQALYQQKQPLLKDLQEAVKANDLLNIASRKLEKEKNIAEYQLNELLADTDFIPSEEPTRSINTLKPEISRLTKLTNITGNSASIEAYDVEHEKYSRLSSDYEQLVSARNHLEISLDKLVVEATDKFSRTFSLVQTTFREIVAKLFVGGEGDIYLTDPENPLYCGIEIKVRPRGKSFKNLDLLSGGEKAITAISLMLSLFKQHPSPICVLDEVDAPLDEANVERFITLIKEWSQCIQFLVVTHNKRSMVEMDKLIGITMEEAGVSKVVAATL